MESSEGGRQIQLEHVVISDGVNSEPQYMINSELLQSQHGLVVDIAGGDFIPVNYTSEDLLPQELTEEDRNLAAALVAVQLSQQQKHQLHDANSSNQLTSIVANSSLGNKLLQDQQIILTDKGSNNGFLHIVSSDNIYVEKQLPKLVSFQNNSNTITTNLYEDEIIEQQSSALEPKTEEINSDGESLRLDTRSSKKSLPHKKRISKKLKKSTPVVKKIKCNLCEQVFEGDDEFRQHEMLCQTTITPVVAIQNFNCQICNTILHDQLKFFEHLKNHYEPTKIEIKEETLKKPDRRSPSPEPEVEVILPDTPAKNTNENLLSSLLCLTCTDCNKTFRKQKTFEQHMRDAHSPKEEPMNNEFSEPEDLMEGINVNVSGNDDSDYEDLEEEDDSKAWYREEELHQTEQDLKELEASNGHICHLCKQPFPLRAILLQHLVTCRVLNANAEPDPMEIVTRKSRKTPPKKKGNLQCTDCDRTFVHRNSLVYHMRSHTGLRPHQCDQCGKSFFASSALKVHLRLHSGLKPYDCKECGKKFRQWGDLKYHNTSIHSNEKNFQCEYCGKEFARKYSLIVHRRIHTGEKNYKCEFCEKTFRASSYLQNHRRIHTGEKPHQCEVCQKPFRVRSDMKRHQKTHLKPAVKTVRTQATPVLRATNTEMLVEEVEEEDGTRYAHMTVAKMEQPDDDGDSTAELHIGEDDEAATHILETYEAEIDPDDPNARELGTTVRMSNRNLYINGNELFLVTYPSDMH